VEIAISPHLGIAAFAIAAPLTFAISVALPPWLLRLREPRPARICWNGWGIVELDGDQVRTAIAWTDARARIEQHGHGRWIQIRDAVGRAITVAEAGATPRWLGLRRAIAADLGALVEAIVDLPPGDPISPDARDRRRPFLPRWVLGLPVVAGAIGTPLLALHSGLRPMAPAFMALMLCALWATTALGPLHELLELLADARRFDRAEEAVLEEGEGDEALIRRSDGSYLRIDVAAAKHPDARLTARTDTPVYVVLPVSGWAPASRRVDVAAAVPIEAIETADERTARDRRIRAVAIELAVRLLAAAYWFVMSISPVFRGEHGT
jgi:hypothetical protein